MICLVSPECGCEDDQINVCIGDIIEECSHTYKDTYEKIMLHQSILKNRVLCYFKGQGNPENFTDSPFLTSKLKPTAIGELLQKRYRSGASTDKKIIEKVEKVALDTCPMCSLSLRLKPNGKKHHKDHILPISKYPEFSLLSLNLVVICSDCNEAKKNTVFIEKKWAFLHPYYDDFLKNKVLTATFAFVNALPEITMSVIPGIKDHDRVCSHIKELDLLKRYANDEPLREATAHFTRSVKLITEMEPNIDEKKLRKTITNITSGEIISRFKKNPNDPLAYMLECIINSADLGSFLLHIRTSNK